MLLIAVLMSSCAGDFGEINVDPPPIGGIDTIIVDDGVVLNTTNGPVQLDGVYTQCNLSNNLAEAPNRTHFLAYAQNLVITGTQPSYDGPLYLLYWSSSIDVAKGTYLVEGITIDPNGIDEENSLYELSITDVTTFSIEGSFSIIEGTTTRVIGEFTTLRYTCDELDIDAEEFVEYADGRMTLKEDSSDERILMSVASYCEDIFPDKLGPSRIIFGGGAFYIDDQDQLTYDEDPELFIVFDMDVITTININENFRAYYIDDPGPILNGVAPITYSEIVAVGSPISVTITSETEKYLEGRYEGILLNGKKVIGSFRANISRGC